MNPFANTSTQTISPARALHYELRNAQLWSPLSTLVTTIFVLCRQPSTRALRYQIFTHLGGEASKEPSSGTAPSGISQNPRLRRRPFSIRRRRSFSDTSSKLERKCTSSLLWHSYHGSKVACLQVHAIRKEQFSAQFIANASGYDGSRSASPQILLFDLRSGQRHRISFFTLFTCVAFRSSQ